MSKSLKWLTSLQKEVLSDLQQKSPTIWDLIVAACREPGLLEREGLSGQPFKLFTRAFITRFEKWCLEHPEGKGR